MKAGKIIAAVPLLAWWACDKVGKSIKKKKSKDDTNTLDNLEKLHALRKSGAISEEDYEELKAKLKEQI